MKPKPYPEYKDSGVEWIGDIPDDWETHRFKINFKYIKGKIPENLQEEARDNSLPYLSMDFLRGKESETLYSETDPKAVKIEKGDILLLWDGSNAGEFLEGKQGYLSSTMVKLLIKNIDPEFSKYICKSFEPLLRDLTIGMGIPHVNGDILGNIRITHPTFQEQKKIVSFLDKKTSEIDLTIEKDTRLIELLQEKRTALINHVVTKGLDPEAPMKDSGVEWIGEIPEEWELKKLKLISKIVLGKMLTPSDKGSYHLKPYLRAQNILWEKVSTDEIKEMWFSKNELKTYRLQKYDLLVSEGGEVGRTAIWKDELDECYIQNSVHKVSLNPGNNPKYFLYAFQACGNSDFFSAIVNRVSIAHLTREKLKEISFPVPNKLEQEKIVNFLDSNIKKIDQIISKIQENIQLLEEYKKSLIHHVVTGKVYVIKED